MAIMKMGPNPLLFDPFHHDTSEGTQGDVLSWIESQWSDPAGAPRPRPMSHGSRDAYRLVPHVEHHGFTPWIPPAMMSTVIELLSKDHLTHPFLSHIFLVPHLMNHIWIKALSKSLIICLLSPFFFLLASLYALPLSVFFLPCSFIPVYYILGVTKRAPLLQSLESYMQQGFQLWSQGRSEQLSDLKGHLLDVWENPENLIQAVLLEFLVLTSKFPLCKNALHRSCYCHIETILLFLIQRNEKRSRMRCPYRRPRPQIKDRRDGDHLMGIPL